MASDVWTQSATLLWPAHPLTRALSSGEVHVWSWAFASAGEPSEDDLTILDEEERQQTARFYFAPDRLRYSTSHANMRRILSSYSLRTPESLVFRASLEGKPELLLARSEPPLHFNLSHSKTIALLAVARDMRVGVDVEDIRPIEAAVAERHFSPTELASLATVDGQQWLDGFYRCWTRKEAVLKAEGVGLRIPLDSFDVSLLANEPAALLAARPESKLTASWHLHHLAAAEGVMGALAVGEASARVSTRSFSR